VISPNGPRNRLLAALPSADLDLLRPHLEFTGLAVHQVLEEPGDLISHLYFIESGLVSIVGIAKPNHRIEVGMIGYEGVTGSDVVLGNDRSANELLVQSAGSALRISIPALRKIMGSSQSFTSTLLNYVHTFMVQGSQTALANGRGRLDERLARWLLMWHDRIQNDEIPTTHELLALLLGVRRAGVTVALHELEGRGLIRSLRGRIRIVDRTGLQLAASGFYGIPECEYERSIGCASGKTFHQVLTVACDSGEVLLPLPSGGRRRRYHAPARNKYLNSGER
jgi:CRP-like cAMP-binding protein